MTAFLQTYKTFSSEQVDPIYIRPAIISVRQGNPTNIAGFDDLLKEGVRNVVTEGAAVANTSGTGIWEDFAGRAGKLEHLPALRTKKLGHAKGSGATTKPLKAMDANPSS